MSRGSRAPVTGNISLSMRDNYGEHGVEQYYKKIGSTYRNPHYPGIRLCIFAWLSKWWLNESPAIATRDPSNVFLFDMACGIGEVTIAFHEWFTLCKHAYKSDMNHSSSGNLLSRKNQAYIFPLDPDYPAPLITATDPFTALAYKDRTSLHCTTLSFNDIAQGELPSFTPYTTIEMVVCSFALHLVDNASALFALLCTLSYKAHWLVVLAPHKKPEIKDGWGWEKWNVEKWSPTPISNHDDEILFER
ncbi:hypothetical protein AGABI1DRAFT_39845 [Agaricus bisporus var. burnettii JB137-S8]|uniref:Methyltransferase domain-containing protein n=1 Tax=Agaricus bisporus var. burnettii (strain JB137-S8 / ATCC MYA-4627 / FGSC 10392) TaxID=597362 RepID=K5WV35_AGABU|nr:uncharacterized protein AGABI1DRAFT_39845 [Agaricus bisporus var. burnettii JB137-S8]EKM79341.1 hypothetical protein AGABI1DRAFT_39845 [Agaricus bisporus var. burnettii JB137-S8]